MNVDALPWEHLCPSVRVDVLQFVATAKGAIRVLAVMPARDLRDALQTWAESEGLGASSDDTYTCVATDVDSSRRLLELDSSPDPHAYELGVALGYPDCCSAAIEAAGEGQIDVLAEAARAWRLTARFQIIDPTGYLDGRAFISHVPCSPTCTPSLALANRAQDWIAANVSVRNTHREPWATWAGLNGRRPR